MRQRLLVDCSVAGFLGCRSFGTISNALGRYQQVSYEDFCSSHNKKKVILALIASDIIKVWTYPL